MAYGTISDDTRQPSDRPREYMGKAFGSGFVTAAAGFALLGTFALTAVYATPRSQPALDARVTDAALSDTVGEQWVVYKQALPVTNAHGAWEFVSDLICPSMGTPTNLGCGGLKTGCKLRLVTFFRLVSRLAPTSCHNSTHANADTHPPPTGPLGVRHPSCISSNPRLSRPVRKPTPTVSSTGRTISRSSMEICPRSTPSWTTKFRCGCLTFPLWSAA